MDSQILDLVTIDGGEKGFEIMLLWPFSVALNETVIRLLGGGIAGPAPIKTLGLESLLKEFCGGIGRSSSKGVSRWT